LKRYDRAYFDRWYRSPRSRVIAPADTARKARMVLGVAEYFLERPVRSVLDVGAGEGAWFRELRRLRPRIRYLGIDPSPYVVERFGARRNVRLGGFHTVADHAGERTFDVIVSADVMQYVGARELEAGLTQIAERLDGVAFLEAHTTADARRGDMRAWHRRTPAHYRRLFTRLGLVQCGPHCWLGDALRDAAFTFERMP
jgi:SAM-dependent methyltransferase